MFIYRLSCCFFRLPLLVLCVVAGCQRSAPSLVQPPTPEVIVTKPSIQNLTNPLEFNGNAAAVETVEVKARVSGFITEIHFSDGQRITKGDPLFSIDQRPYLVVRDQARADVAKALAELNELESEVARYKNLLPKAVVTREQYEILVAKRDVANAMLDKSRAIVAQAELDIEFCQIISPLTGRVSTREVDVGDLVTGTGSSATRLTTVVTTSPIEVYFDTDERALLLARQRAIAKRGGEAVTWRDIKELEIPVSARLVTEELFLHKGILDFVDIGVKPTTGTVRCRGLLPNPEELITPGMFMRVQMTTAEPEQTMLVPERALGIDQGRKYVAVVSDKNRVEYRTVTTGRSVPARSGMLRVIEEGLDKNDRVVISGMSRAREGSTVQPVEETAESSTPQEVVTP
ncbi:MAG: efflux RND transporter periplasmic adaptor subunit [Pirellulales bacterium]